MTWNDMEVIRNYIYVSKYRLRGYYLEYPGSYVELP